MVENEHDPVTLESVYYQSAWIRVNHGGILLSHVQLGEKITKDKVLGVVTDPITNNRSEILSPYNGQIIGMAVDQVVMPGFAGFHIGIQETEKKITKTDNSTGRSQSSQFTGTAESE